MIRNIKSQKAIITWIDASQFTALEEAINLVNSHFVYDNFKKVNKSKVIRKQIDNFIKFTNKKYGNEKAIKS